MKNTACIVTQGGLPCTLYNASRVATTKRGGVLLPGAPVALFAQPRDAKRALARTERVAKQLDGSLLDGWVKLLPLRSGQPYAVVPLVKQS